MSRHNLVSDIDIRSLGFVHSHRKVATSFYETPSEPVGPCVFVASHPEWPECPQGLLAFDSSCRYPNFINASFAIE